MSADSQTAFLAALRQTMAAHRSNQHLDNYDAEHFGPEPVGSVSMPMWRQHLRGIWGSVTHAIAYYRSPEDYYANDAEAFRDVHFLHNLVGNQKSKDLVLALCAFRAMGRQKVKLPRNTPDHWLSTPRIEGLRSGDKSVPIRYLDSMGMIEGRLPLYDCKPIGFDLRVFASKPGIACAMMQEQYAYIDTAKDVRCVAEPGDVVLDCGGCWGETMLYFAHEVGPTGAVVVFEFIPSNLEVLDANLEENPALAKRVQVVRQPVWRTSGLKLYFVDWGPGSRVTEDAAEYNFKFDGECETVCIDDTVDRLGLTTVNMIKMDIEGAELSALRGAEKTICKYRPKLAISLYHRLSDFTTIPRYIFELGLEYDFFVDHHTIYENETVLFAVPSDRAISG